MDFVLDRWKKCVARKKQWELQHHHCAPPWASQEQNKKKLWANNLETDFFLNLGQHNAGFEDWSFLTSKCVKVFWWKPWIVRMSLKMSMICLLWMNQSCHIHRPMVGFSSKLLAALHYEGFCLLKEAVRLSLAVIQAFLNMPVILKRLQVKAANMTCYGISGNNWEVSFVIPNLDGCLDAKHNEH